jgi:hypothetical protein
MPAKFIRTLSFIFLLSFSVCANQTAESLAIKAVSTNPSESHEAIKELRLMNQKGLDSLLNTYQKEIENFKRNGTTTSKWERISTAIDQVAMQKDAFSSGLYWETDLEKAQTEAGKTGKPILSLRLLGNLNEEYSCANSRFFRSILYSNTQISAYLRENYILHWRSVRPAPKITIDFGDGRKLVRTITGNSIHYILDKNGKILDALPGLYDPQNFLKYIVDINRANQRKLKPKNFWSNYYRNNNRLQLLAKWQNDLTKLGIDVKSASGTDINLPTPPPKTRTAETTDKSTTNKNPSALKAAVLAVTKSIVEMPTVRSITYDTEALKDKTTFEEWKKLSVLFGQAKIDKSSKTFILRKSSSENNLTAQEKRDLISNLEKYISIDTVQNEYIFHTKIYEWLNKALYTDVEMFNERVYSELFLTPKSDKWLGLYSPDIYSAIENNGVVSIEN